MIKKVMIKEAYCSFEVSKLLKEKGFNWRTQYVYTLDGTGSTPHKIGNWKAKSNIQKPTQQMAMRWLREVHDIETCVEYSIPDDAYNYIIIVKDVTNGFTIIHSEGTYEVYEKATDELLKYCLENLI